MGKDEASNETTLLEEITKMYAIISLIDFISHPNGCVFMETREKTKRTLTNKMGEKRPQEGDGICQSITNKLFGCHNVSNHLPAHHPCKLLNFCEQVNQSLPASNLIKVVTNWLIPKQNG